MKKDYCLSLRKNTIMRGELNKIISPDYSAYNNCDTPCKHKFTIKVTGEKKLRPKK